MKTKIPEKIESMEAVNAYLTELHNNDEAYHPEDDAREIDNLFTREEGEQLNTAMEQVYAVCNANGADPCEILLRLGGHVYED